MAAETMLEYFPDANKNNQILSEIPADKRIKILSRNLYEIKNEGKTSSSYIYSVGEAHTTINYSDIIIKDINYIIHKLNLDISNINIEIISERNPNRDIEKGIDTNITIGILPSIAFTRLIKKISGQYADRRHTYLYEIMYHVLDKVIIDCFKDYYYKNKEQINVDYLKSYITVNDNDELKFDDINIRKLCRYIYYIIMFEKREKIFNLFENKENGSLNDLKLLSYYARALNTPHIEEHVNLLPKEILRNMLCCIIIVPYFIVTKLSEKYVYEKYIVLNEKLDDSDEKYIVPNKKLDDSDEKYIVPNKKLDDSDVKYCNDRVLELYKRIIPDGTIPDGTISDTTIHNYTRYILNSLIKYINSVLKVKVDIDAFFKIINENKDYFKSIIEIYKDDTDINFSLCFYDFYVYDFIQSEEKKKNKECNFYCILSGDKHTQLMDKVFTEINAYKKIENNSNIFKKISIIDTLKNYNIIDKNYNVSYDKIISILKYYNNNYTLNKYDSTREMYINTLSNNALPSKNGLIYQFFQDDSDINPFVSEVPIFYNDTYKKLIKLLFNYDLDEMEFYLDNEKDVVDRKDVVDEKDVVDRKDILYKEYNDKKIDEVLHIIKKYNKYKYDKCALHDQDHEKCKKNQKNIILMKNYLHT
jgi:hypothetical protein